MLDCVPIDVTIRANAPIPASYKNLSMPDSDACERVVPLTPSLRDWAITIYNDDVKPILLQLQDDFGLNVNILLWCAWAGRHGITLPRASFFTASALIELWDRPVTQALRAARRHAGVPANATTRLPSAVHTILNDRADHVYALAKKAELEAEWVMIDALETATTYLRGVGHANLAAVRRNIYAYVAEVPRPAGVEFSVERVESLITAIETADPAFSDRSHANR